MADTNKSGLSVTDTEAEEYVESIMASQLITRVDTPMHTGRKRHHSETDATDICIDSTVKKPRFTTKAKRNLYGDIPFPAPKTVTVTSADVHVDGKTSIEQMLSKLSADMHMLFSSLSERVNDLEKGLEQKIANKVAQVLDKRVTTEMNRIRKDVDERMSDIKESICDEFKAEIVLVNTKIESLSNSATVNNSDNDITLNIVIRDLPETENENTAIKVNKLIKDGLKVHGVTCKSADRKNSRSSSKPGLVIAKMRSHEDKRKVMSNKSKLLDHQQYSGVFVQHDQSQADRVMANNFRTILQSLKGSNLTVRGSRVVQKNASNQQNSRRNTRNTDNGYRQYPNTHGAAHGRDNNVSNVSDRRFNSSESNSREDRSNRRPNNNTTGRGRGGRGRNNGGQNRRY